jgi:tetratricopeptide (TPR) repeat protein
MNPLAATLENARSLLAKDPSAAVAFLLEAKPPGHPTPLAYSIALAQALLTDGRAADAVECLQEAEMHRFNPAPRLSRVLAEALIADGRAAEAGQSARHALRTGTPLTALSFKQKHALADYLQENAPDDPGLPELRLHLLAENCIYDTDHHVALVYTEKVACSVLKATLVMNGPMRGAYLDAGISIHEFCNAEMKPDQALPLLAAPEIFRFAVVRDPARRALSAYLNKFVGRAPRTPQLRADKSAAIRRAQSVLGIAPDQERSISFEEFCHYLANAYDLEMNSHWMPQWRAIGRDPGVYSHLGRFEDLNATFAVLAEKFGYEPETDAARHLGGTKNHKTPHTPDNRIADPHKLLPAELDRHRRGYPMPEAFLTPDLQSLLETRFAPDRALHAAAG